MKTNESHNELFTNEAEQLASRCGKALVKSAAAVYICKGILAELTGKALSASTGSEGARLAAGAAVGESFIPALAEAIDRYLDGKCKKDEATEEVVAEPTDDAVEAFAAAPADTEDETDTDADEEDGDALPEGVALSRLRFIDVKAQPEEYDELKKKEAAGEIQIIYRYRRSFRSRLIQSQGGVQEYYSALKNRLLSYKGNKDRLSFGCESFNKGRTYVAKINARAKTLYLYLAMDPASLTDPKYEIEDVSAVKKYENVPMLIKIRGERKFRYALELIDKLCGETLGLRAIERAEEDFTIPYQSTEALVEEGSIRKLAAGIPVGTEAAPLFPKE